MLFFSFKLQELGKQTQVSTIVFTRLNMNYNQMKDIETNAFVFCYAIRVRSSEDEIIVGEPKTQDPMEWLEWINGYNNVLPLAAMRTLAKTWIKIKNPREGTIGKYLFELGVEIMKTTPK